MNTLFFLLGKCGRIKNFFEEMDITFTSCKKPILSELTELKHFSFVREFKFLMRNNGVKAFY